MNKLPSNLLPPPQAAVIRQDSILELLVRAGPAPPSAPVSTPGLRLNRSMSGVSGMDSSGDVVLLRRQVELLQEEVARLRLKGEEPVRDKVEPGSKKASNGETGDVIKGKKVIEVWLLVNKAKVKKIDSEIKPR